MIDYKISDEKLIQLYKCCIFNYLNYDIYYCTINNLNRKIEENTDVIKHLKYCNTNLREYNNNWNKDFTPLKLYKSMICEGVYFPFIDHDNYISFGTHRLWSIFLYGKIIKSNRIVPIMKFKKKEIIVFLPNEIYKKINLYKNIYYDWDGDNGSINIKNYIYKDEYITLVKINACINSLVFLLGDLVSYLMYKRNILFHIPEISCPICHNKTDIVKFRQSILNSMNINYKL